MRIDEIIESTYPTLSVEFFPPKDEESVQRLYQTVEALKPLDPAFVSVTYGAGGSTRDKTIDIVRTIRDDYGIEAMAHMTTVGATAEELREVVGQVREAGIENVLALRGDPPRGEDTWTQTPGGLANAAELAVLIGEDGDFAIGGACFPEVHPEAVDAETDLTYLKRKVDNGVQFLITQLFFDVDLYFDFVAAARERGIDVPIIPGVMPIRSFAQIKRFAAMCGAGIPEPLATQMEALGGDEDAEFELGLAYAAQQAARLLERGAPGIHFYGLNRVPAARALLGMIRAARPWERSGAHAQAVGSAADRSPTG